MTDGLLHGALEGLVGGGDGQEEVFGAELPLREEPLVLKHLPSRSSSSSLILLDSCCGGGDGVEEGHGGRREEAGGWDLLSSCGKTEEVLQRDGAPTN